VLRLRTFGGLKVENSAGDANLSMRPRQLALLAIVAASGKNGIGREKALGILWADSSPQSARHALSQTLYGLKRELGADVIPATPVLHLDSSKIESDVGQFKVAIAGHDWSSASALYSGPFLEGFYLGEAPDFERWSEAVRSDLALHGLRAIESVAVDHEKAARLHEAVQARRRLTRLDPLSDAYAAAYMEVLAAAGDRAGALAHGKSFAEHLRRELDTEPGENFERLMKRLRTRPTASLEHQLHRDIAPHVTPAPAMSAAAIPSDEGPKPGRKANRWMMPLSVAGVATVVIIGGWFFVRGKAANPLPNEQPVLAVGRIRDLVTPDSARLGGVLGEIMTTSLSRLTPLQVIAKSRMLELTPRDADTVRTALVDAARRAGATEVIEGELIPLRDGRLRLDIRRVNLRDGRIRAGYGVIGDDRMTLLDSVTILIAADLRLAAPVQSLAEVSTRSPLAHRYYEDGLRAFYQYDAYAANRLFRAAIREDSTFAMATYYAWRSSAPFGDTATASLGERALRLAPKASERDRLLILAHIGGDRRDRRALYAVDTLVMRYGSDPEALLIAGSLVLDLRRAIILLNRAIMLDSAAGVLPSAICRLCSALGTLATRYQWADSSAMVESTMRRSMRLRPEDAGPWFGLADHFVSVGRLREAEDAQRRAEALGGLRGNQVERKLTWAMRSDDFDGAISQCRTLLATVDRFEFPSYRWYCTIALRMVGRFEEALALVREGKVPGSTMIRRGTGMDSLLVGILEWETGRYREAAAKLGPDRSVSAGAATDAQRSPAPNIWHMTLAASAALSGGDTLFAKSLVDSIEAEGGRSSYARDIELHHFIRGQLLAKRGDQAGAVRQYRQALVSPTFGYTRINYELAKSLVLLGRPMEAVPLMQAVLRGGLEGSDLYLTRTEAHDVLARAFEQAGPRDSAIAHFRVVERAWRKADPILKQRYEYARSRVAGNWH